MKQFFNKVKYIWVNFMATFSHSYCYDSMEMNGIAVFGCCTGDGEGEFSGCCTNCPYYLYSKEGKSHANHVHL